MDFQDFLRLAGQGTNPVGFVNEAVGVADRSQLKDQFDAMHAAAKAGDRAAFEAAVKATGLKPETALQAATQYGKTGKLPDYTANDSAVAGETMNWGDELKSAARAAGSAVTGGSFGDAYDASQKEQKLAHDVFSQRHRAADVIGELLGGSALAPVAGGGGLLKTLGTGAGYGFLSGAGAGDGIGDRAMRGTVGGVIGAGVGAGASALGSGLSAILRKMSGSGGAEGTATEKIMSALQAGKITPEDAKTYLTQLAADSPSVPITLPDVPAAMGGESNQLAQLAASAARKSPEAEAALADVLKGRAAESGTRAKAALGSALGVDPATVNQSAQQIIDNVGQGAPEAFAQAYAAHPEIIDHPDLLNLLLRNASRGAVDTANTVRDAAGQPAISAIKETVSPLQNMIDSRGAPLGAGPKIEPNVTSADLHDIIKALGARVETGGSRLNTSSQERAANAALAGLKGDLTSVLKESNPELAGAMSQFADQAALERALAAGRSFHQYGSAAELADTLNGLGSSAEKQAFRTGAAQALMSNLDKTSDGGAGNAARNAFQKIAGSEDTRGRIASMIDSPSKGDAYQRTLDLEAVMAPLRDAVLGGSRTSKDLLREEASRGGAGTAVANAIASLATGGPLAAGKSLIWKAAPAVMDRLTAGSPEVAANVGDKLSRSTPQGLLDLLTELEKTQAARQAAQTAGQGAARATTIAAQPTIWDLLGQ